MKIGNCVFSIYFYRMEKQNTISIYRERLAQHQAEHKKYKGKSNFNATARLLVFVAAAIGFYFALSTTVLVVSAVLFSTIVIFLILVQYSAKLENKVQWHREMTLINEENIKALNGDYSSFKNGKLYADAAHPFSYDLDIFGQNGFFQTINRTVRPGGERLLANWFTQPLLEWNKIEQRQHAFKELAQKPGWRHKFLAHARINQLDEAAETLFKQLSAQKVGVPAWISSSVLRWGVPLLTIASVILAAWQLIPVGYLILFVLLQWGLVGFAMKYTKKADAALGRTEKIMQGQKSLIALITNESWKSEPLSEISSAFQKGDEPAMHSIKQLAAIIKSFEYRNNLIIAVIANSFLLWDIQCITRFRRWHAKASVHMTDWMQALDKMDAMVSGGAYWQNNPEFCIPRFDPRHQLESKELGHPLLPEQKRVVNDYSFPEGTLFHIVTGANMAGKSTFLRTVSLNMVMAMAGLPVCARNFAFKPVAVFTSMRTTDSLSKDESYFYAELRRLREAYNRIRKDERLFLVLDEILKGTNSEDKRKGSVDFLTQLIQYDVAGIVATHDTQLGELAQQLPEHFDNYCFEIEIEGEHVNFDYKLQPGITQTMNAQLLMKQMGLIK